MWRNDGFTLLEVTVGLAIVLMVSVAALGAVGQELAGARRIRPVLGAIAVAEERLETLRLLQRGELAALPDSLARGEVRSGKATYHWTASAESVGVIPGLFEVEVHVSWENGTRRLATRVYRPQ
jgi:type II secretion system protein I